MLLNIVVQAYSLNIVQYYVNECIAVYTLYVRSSCIQVLVMYELINKIQQMNNINLTFFKGEVSYIMIVGVSH